MPPRLCSVGSRGNQASILRSKVHFVLGVNMEALQSIVCAKYGERFDAEAYLRKFVNVTFSLTGGERAQRNGELVSYTTRLSEEMDLPKRLSDRCVNLIQYIVRSNNVSLRDIGKISSKIALVPEEISHGSCSVGYVDVICFLIVSSVVSPAFHKSYISGSAKLADIEGFLGCAERLTANEIEGKFNDEYDGELTSWLVEVAFCCCPGELDQANHLPEWRKNVQSQFGSHGSLRSVSGLPLRLQKDCVDLFRI